MAPQAFNPLQPITDSLRQLSEQGATFAKSGLDSMAQASSSLLRGLSALPGLPTPAAAEPAPGNNSGKMPTLQQVLANPIQAITQAEDVALPDGAPRPLGQLTKGLPDLPGATRRRARVEPAAEARVAQPAPTPVRAGGVIERRGV